MSNVRSVEGCERHRQRRNLRRSERRRAARQAEMNGFKSRPRLAADIDRDAHRLAKARERYRAKRDARPFIGCDGEGTTNKGEHRYALFRIGDRELFKGGRRLTTPELLTFILESPPPSSAILIGFAFEYDVANILRDVPMAREHPDIRSRMERILHPDESADRQFRDPWTWLAFDGWREFGVAYLPRHYLKVCYATTYTVKTKKGVIRKRRSIKSSIRTIEDSFGFFQAPFLKAINAWSVGEKYWQQIERNKARRSSFRAITPAIRRYNQLECELLAQMMTALRQATIDAGICLNNWDGAGRIASFMLKTNGAKKRKELERKLPKGLLKAAHAAYYGGRFEVTRLGQIDQEVIEADISSAYPAGLLAAAPCHLHGKWKRTPAAVLQRLLRRRELEALFVAPVAFRHPKTSFLCGLPFRRDDGVLMWPQLGRGTYWSIELASAMKLGAKIAVEGHGWLYERKCDCAPYDWLKRAYEARRALGKATKGIPLKLGVNAVYGKLCQRIGGAPWQNIIDAGLATAWTRAQLNAAIDGAGPRNVVMIATDAIYVVASAKQTGDQLTPVEAGDGLGLWEIKTHRKLFIAQPGLYWPPKGRVKTRGIAPRFFEPMVPQFHRAWSTYLRKVRKVDGDIVEGWGTHVHPPPVVLVEVVTFIGLRLAMHRKTYGDVCKWLKNTRLISFDWKQKRFGLGEVHQRSLILDPKAGDRAATSLVYTPAVRPDWIDKVETAQAIEDDLIFEAMPDPVDLTPPFK